MPDLNNDYESIFGANSSGASTQPHFHKNEAGNRSSGNQSNLLLENQEDARVVPDPAPGVADVETAQERADRLMTRIKRVAIGGVGVFILFFAFLIFSNGGNGSTSNQPDSPIAGNVADYPDSDKGAVLAARWFIERTDYRAGAETYRSALTQHSSGTADAIGKAIADRDAHSAMYNDQLTLLESQGQSAEHLWMRSIEPVAYYVDIPDPDAETINRVLLVSQAPDGRFAVYQVHLKWDEAVTQWKLVVDPRSLGWPAVSLQTEEPYMTYTTYQEEL